MTRVGPGTGGFLTAMVVDALGSGVWITFSLLYFTYGQGLSLTSAGAALSAGALTALVLGGLAVGVLTDWLGPYAAATLSCAIRAVAFPCYLFADGPALVAATAFAVSFGDRLYWAAHGGLVEDVTSSGYGRRQLFALLNSLRNVGLGVGALSVALGAAVERADSALFWHAIPLANAASFAVAGVLFRRVGGRDRPVGIGGTGPGLTSYRAVVADHRFLVFTGATLALTLASVGFDSILPIYLWSLGLPLWLPPAAYVLSCVAIPASQPVALRLGQRRPAMALMALAAVLIASALSGLVALHWLDPVGDVVLTAGLVLVFSLGEAIFGAVVMTIVLSFAARDNVGRYSAFYQLAWGLSGALGPGLHTWLFSVSSNAPWLTVTGALLVSTALYLRLARTGPEPAETAAPQFERKIKMNRTAEETPDRHAQERDRITDTVFRSLRRFWAGRGVVLVLDDFDQRAGSLADELHACGARVGAVVARTNPAPGAPPVERSWHCTDAGLDLTRPQFEAWLRIPSDTVRAWLDELDPAQEWLVLGTPRTGVAKFCGRTVHGWRRPEWAAVEDKTTIDRLWAATGVAAPPHLVVTVEELTRDPTGLAEVSGPAGVVVSADSTRGHVGDSLGLRWVPERIRLPDAVRDLRDHTDRVRIARFTNGVPCSVLGMALPDGVAVFSPIEIVTLGDPVTGQLLFCGSSTYWRPDETAVRDIRESAYRAGAELVRTTGYRGIFSVDGLLTPAGFAATELNPRHASGLGLRAALPDFPIYLFNRAVQEDLPGLAGITSAGLEHVVRREVAAAPSYSLSVPVTQGTDGAARLVTADGQVIDYRARDGAASLLAVASTLPDHRAGPACAALAAHLGEPGLRSFPLAAVSA